MASGLSRVLRLWWGWEGRVAFRGFDYGDHCMVFRLSIHGVMAVYGVMTDFIW